MTVKTVIKLLNYHNKSETHFCMNFHDKLEITQAKIDSANRTLICMSFINKYFFH